jgi:endonuclease/exonuclease/phosphatase family metal-dependent hydrolase
METIRMEHPMTRFRFAVIAAAASLIGGCCSSWNPFASDAADAIRVASYNIRLATGDKGTPNAWTERQDDMVNLIRRLDVDAGGLQEVRPEQMAFLRERLPEFEFVGEHRGADRVSDEASPVFYRKSRFEAERKGTFWLSETPDVPGVKGWGAACPRVCSYLVLRDKSTGRRFCFANTHTDHVSALAREKGMLLVIERMKEFGAGAPIVFTGDHNCRETEAPAVAVSKLLRNALYESETTPKGPWRTFNGWQWRDREVATVDALKLPENVRNARRGSPDADKDRNGGHKWEDCGARIDYIYVSPGVRVVDYATVADPRPGKTLYPSDHFPIVATVELSKSE